VPDSGRDHAGDRRGPGGVGHQAIAAAPPVPALFAHLLLAVAVPVSLGFFARTRWPAATERLRPAAWRFAIALLALLIALIILNDVPAFMASLPDAVPLAVCFIAASLAIGAGVARTLRANWPDGVALAIEFATRNVAVATMAAVTVMGRIEFAIFGTAYFLTEVPLMVAAAVALRAVARRRAGQRSVRGSLSSADGGFDRPLVTGRSWHPERAVRRAARLRRAADSAQETEVPGAWPHGAEFAPLD